MQIYFRLLLISLSAIGFNSYGEENTRVCPLNESQIASLIQGSNGDYSVSVMKGHVNGAKRTVVVLGENHIKDKRAEEVGKEIISQFSFRGVEGSDVSQHWGSIFFPATKKIGQFINSFKYKNRTQGSTITAAEMPDLEEAVLEQLKEMAANGEFGQLGASDLPVTFQISSTDGKLHFTSNGDSASDELDTIVNIPLEFGHKPGIIENLTVLSFPVMALSCLGTICGVGSEFLYPNNGFSEVMSNTSMIVSLFLAMQFYGAKKFVRWQNTEVYRILFALGSGLVLPRDQTMADNTVKALDEDRSGLPILLIVGNAHVSGIEFLLETQYGFQKENLKPVNP